MCNFLGTCALRCPAWGEPHPPPLPPKKIHRVDQQRRAVTPTQAITIAGARFTVPLRYAEGHVLTAGEANALNQTYLENCRNNLSGKAKDGTLTQEIVDQYAASYVFGQRTGGFGLKRPRRKHGADNRPKARQIGWHVCGASHPGGPGVLGLGSWGRH